MSVDTKNIRNVVLLGHSGSGKTTLAETMLFEGKEISRRGVIENQSTVSDFTDIEHEKGNSLFSTLMHVNWRKCKINIIDTPGLDDYVGEVISALKIADTAVMVLNGASGVEVGTEIMWEYIQEYKTPSIFVVNQMDHEKCDYDQTLDQAKNRFGSKVFPIQYPLNQGSEFDTIVDILRMTMYKFSPEGGKPEKIPIPDSEIQKAQELHNQLVEIAAENDEGLMEVFFDQGSLSEEELAKGLTLAIASGDFCPLFCASSTKNMGSGRIMGFINDICPDPSTRPQVELENGETLACDPNGTPAVFIFKTYIEPRVGHVSYLKVYSGTLKSGDELYNNVKSNTERISQLYVGNGKNRTSVDELRAGDIGMTVKLKDSETNSTLVPKGSDIKIKPIQFPSSRIRTAITSPSKADMEKLVKALHIIHEEDPTLIIEHSKELKQMLLHGQGQLHLDTVKQRVESEHGLKMDFLRPRIPFRETITKQASDSYRHKKQSGGSGQFGEVHMRIEPYYEGMPDPEALNVRNKDIEELPWGGTLAFYWCIVGGAIDTKYANAIKKGVMNKMMEGPLTGSHCIDIRVCVYDGKMHAVDSNDMAFMLAANQVFKTAFVQAGPQLMEPIFDLEILCSGDVMGDVMSDLQTRRAIIQGMDSEGHYQKIMTKVPLMELYKYSATLRAISQGRAKFKRKFAEYSPVPHDIQKKLIAEYKQEEVEA